MIHPTKKQGILIAIAIVLIIALTTTIIVVLNMAGNQQESEQNQSSNTTQQNLEYNGNTNTQIGNGTSASNGNISINETNNANTNTTSTSSNESRINENVVSIGPDTGKNIEDKGENDVDKLDWNSIDKELVNNQNTMDRTKLTETATNFVNAYYNINDDTGRKTSLGSLLDLDYIRDQGQNSILYMDYYKGTSKPDDTLVSINSTEIDNAQSPNATVRANCTLKRTMKMDDGTMQEIQHDITIKMSINSDYKIKSIYIQS